MAIQKVSDSTEIVPGQWVCPASRLIHRICEAPRKVSKSSGKRVYVAERDGANLGNFISRKSCVYLCDTADEAAAVYAISRNQDDAITASTQAIKDEFSAQLNSLSGGAVPV